MRHNQPGEWISAGVAALRPGKDSVMLALPAYERETLEEVTTLRKPSDRPCPCGRSGYYQRHGGLCRCCTQAALDMALERVSQKRAAWVRAMEGPGRKR